MGIEVQGLTKSYGSVQVLRDVSFSCPSGKITGLLGPNGSGKSTTMRAMVGLGRPDAGRTTFDGVGLDTLPNPGRVVGTLLDASAHHPGRSLHETVTLAGILLGAPRERVRSVIEVMGLGSVQKRRFRELSLGMRQRVGLAIALLGNPTHLVLDEPVNGLDIEGINWLRGMLVRFAREGGTVLISSHLLGELQTYVDRVVIIDRGTVVAEREMSDVAPSRLMEVRTPDAELLSRELTARRLVHRTGATGDTLLVEGDGHQVAVAAREAGALVVGLAPADRHSLETLYLGMTAGEFAAKDAEGLFHD